MNKKSQTFGITITIAIMLFIVGMLSINFIKPAVTEARDASNLNCSDSTISDGTKLTCLVVDLVVPYFIIAIFAISGGIIVSRILL